MHQTSSFGLDFIKLSRLKKLLHAISKNMYCHTNLRYLVHSNSIYLAFRSSLKAGKVIWYWQKMANLLSSPTSTLFLFLSLSSSSFSLSTSLYFSLYLSHSLSQVSSGRQHIWYKIVILIFGFRFVWIIFLKLPFTWRHNIW